MVKQAKRLSTYIQTVIFGIAISVTLFSCSANYHVLRAIKKGYKCEEVSDTIRITSVDSFPVIVNDTIVWQKYITQKDTVVMWKTQYVPKTRWEKKIEYKLKRDTIRQIQKVEVAKYKSEKKSKANIWLFVIGFGLGIFTKYLFQYAKKAL
jgi:hypothetical protein